MKTFTVRIMRAIGWPGAVLLASALVSWALVSCANSPASGGEAAATGKGGAELWADNCQRCHNLRSPSNYSPAQWSVVMMHMRVRANLTPEEHKKILEFLQAGS